MKLINEENILLNISVRNKKDLFAHFAEIAYESKLTTDKKKLVKGFLEREKESSTGMEKGFAIPHAKIDEITKPAILVAKINSPIKWKTFDKSKVKIAIALLIPKSKVEKIHIKILSALAKKLLDNEFRNSMIEAKSKSEIIELMSKIKVKE